MSDKRKVRVRITCEILTSCHADTILDVLVSMLNDYTYINAQVEDVDSGEWYEHVDAR